MANLDGPTAGNQLEICTAVDQASQITAGVPENDFAPDQRTRAIGETMAVSAPQS